MSQITDQIKDRLDIVEIVREYVPQLKKTGANWKARCPFHQEKTASFLVSSQKQIWHCFGCAKGGDIFGFIREIEGVEFGDSLRILAKRAGVKLEDQDPKKESQRARILDMLRLASRWYHKALLTAKSADKARAYIKERRISDKSRDNWQLGFAPDAWEGVSAYLKTRGYNDQEIERAGLSSKNDRGSSYDRFRNRLMFPISDVHGSIIGFTARKMSDKDVGGKYINTPETEVYHKSSVLYGLSRAKKAIREAGLAVLVEGNMDCVSSHQAGIENTVASSGTAFTEEQARLLKRFTKNIALAFDPDSAGQEALARGMETAWQEEMMIKVIQLPENKDPDDLIKQDVGEWRELIKNAAPFIDSVIARAEKENDLSSAEGKKSASKTILTWIARLSDPIEQTHYLQILSNKVNVSEEILRSVAAKKGLAADHAGLQRVEEKNFDHKQNIYEKTAIRLFAIMVADKKKRELQENWLESDKLIELYKNLEQLYDVHIEAIQERLRPMAREIILISEEIKGQTNKEERDLELKSLLARLKGHHNKKEISCLQDKINKAEQENDEQSLRKYMEEWQKLSAR